MTSPSDIEKQIEEFNTILLEYVRNRNSNAEEIGNSVAKLKSMVRSEQIETKSIETQTTDLPTFDRTINDGTTSLYQNFIRLSLLFPECHPATLHGALGLCKNDFILTVDSLIYARNYRKSSENNSNMENENKDVISEIFKLSPQS